MTYNQYQKQRVESVSTSVSTIKLYGRTHDFPVSWRRMYDGRSSGINPKKERELKIKKSVDSSRMLTDEEIYYRYIAEKKEDDLRRLFDRHSGELLLFINTYVHDMNDAEELMLDSFMSLIESKVGYRNECSFKSYLFSIGRNLAKKHLRNAKKRTAKFIDESDVLGQFIPENILMRKENHQKLYEAIRQLPLRYQQVIFLVELDQMSIDETALVLGKNRKQIYNLCFRGKQALKKILAKTDGIV